jgi:hypothetical protein
METLHHTGKRMTCALTARCNKASRTCVCAPICSLRYRCADQINRNGANDTKAVPKADADDELTDLTVNDKYIDALPRRAK